MKIGICIDVFRDKINKLAYVYEQFKDDEPNLPVTSYNLLEHFPFSGGTEELNEYLYSDAALDICGYAMETEQDIVRRFNKTYWELKDLGHEVFLISRELLKSKPSTLFFLSKTLTEVNDIKFVRTYEEKWDHADILVTDNPFVLNSKPKGKISIKLEREYNINDDSDYTIKSSMNIIDKEFWDKVTNIETVEYKTIK